MADIETYSYLNIDGTIKRFYDETALHQGTGDDNKYPTEADVADKINEEAKTRQEVDDVLKESIATNTINIDTNTANIAQLRYDLGTKPSSSNLDHQNAFEWLQSISTELGDIDSRTDVATRLTKTETNITNISNRVKLLENNTDTIIKVAVTKISWVDANITIPAGSYSTLTQSPNQIAGYTPIGIVGYNVNGTYQVNISVWGCFLKLDRSAIYCRLKNNGNSTWSSSVNVYVLYIKDELL